MYGNKEDVGGKEEVLRREYIGYFSNVKLVFLLFFLVFWRSIVFFIF